MTADEGKKVRVPPRWFERLAWRAHRGVVRVTGGRVGLWPPKPGKWGAFRLTTIGRRSGQERSVILAYFEDGDALVTMAMNGWTGGEPMWWRNLQANPGAGADLKGGVHRRVRARAAEGAERERLWARWAELDQDLDEYAALRDIETAVVVLDPAGD
ncbi:MAG: nitroreductase family deazaflavin-dependent oxidoreductase [Actinobacteria bacterium]|nr:nitroreductase family deazaflavin-dependent oxidoreductase [Actinomycetota bacterium]